MSIFTGYMSEEMMKEMHVEEYEEIMAARRAMEEYELAGEGAEGIEAQ